MTIDDFVQVLKPALTFCIIGADKVVVNRNIDNGITVRILSNKTYKTIVIPEYEIRTQSPTRIVYEILGGYFNEINEEMIQKETFKAIKRYLKDKVITDV